jgi:FtsH-binding integral membrane protein
VIGETTFQPGVDNVYPPYFTPGSTFKKVDATDHTNGLLNDMSDLIAYITDKSTTINMPSLENSKYSIYRDGIVLVNRQITTIFHVNRIHSYVGVLEINTASMTTRVGYVQSSTNVKTAWFQSYNRNKPYSSAVIFLTPYTPYVRRAMDEQAVDTVPPTPTILQFDMKSMETRENDEMLSLFTSTYTATSGVIINSATLVVDKTTTAISSIYEVGGGVGGAIGQAGVWVYDSTVAVVSAVWDLTKMSIYLVCVVLGVYLISQVGPGLKEATQSYSKKRKLK